MNIRLRKTAMGLIIGWGVLLVAVLLGLQPTQIARAATLQVCPTCPYTSVQAALNVAVDGDLIQVEEGTYTETAGTVAVINHSIRLYGGYYNSFGSRRPDTHPSILDAQGLGPVIVITSTASAPISPTVDGFVIINGLADARACPSSWTGAQCGGGIGSINANPTIRGNTIRDNRGGNGTDGNGGGIWIAYPSTVAVITNNTILNNVANVGGKGSGGGILVYSGDAIVYNNRIQGNTGSTVNVGLGGGLLHYIGSLTAQKNTIQNNVGSVVSDASGGGIYLYNTTSTLITNTVSNNSSNGAGGGIEIQWGSASLNDNAIQNNTASNGGGLYISNATVVFDKGLVRGNTAPGAGGIYADIHSTITIRQAQVLSNTATSITTGAGGIRIASSTATITGTTVAHNSGGSGGGIYVSTDSSALIADNQVYANTAVRGGGIRAGGPVTITGNTIYSNTAGSGGGIRLDDSPAALISNNQIYLNVADGHGGVANQGGGIGAFGRIVASILTNTIRNNSAADGAGLNSGADAGIPLQLTLNGNTVQSNTASSAGGGIFLWGSVAGASPIQAGLTGNTIRGNTSGGGGGIYVSGGNVTISLWRNDLLSNTAEDGAAFWACTVGSVTADTLMFANNTATLGSVIRGCTAQAGPVRFTNSIVVSNTGNGISTSSGMTLANNLFAYNTGHGATAGVSPAPTVVNNIFYQNGGCGVNGPAGGFGTLDYNDSWGNAAGNYCSVLAGTHSLEADPKFINPAQGNWHIPFGSPAMNGGVLTAAPTYDREGVVRPQFTFVDIGPYEVSTAPFRLFMILVAHH